MRAVARPVFAPSHYLELSFYTVFVPEIKFEKNDEEAQSTKWIMLRTLILALKPRR